MCYLSVFQYFMCFKKCYEQSLKLSLKTPSGFDFIAFKEVLTAPFSLINFQQFLQQKSINILFFFSRFHFLN